MVANTSGLSSAASHRPTPGQAEAFGSAGGWGEGYFQESILSKVFVFHDLMKMAVALLDLGACDVEEIKAQADEIIMRCQNPSDLLVSVSLAKDALDLIRVLSSSSDEENVVFYHNNAYYTESSLMSYSDIFLGCAYWLWERRFFDVETMQAKYLSVLMVA